MRIWRAARSARRGRRCSAGHQHAAALGLQTLPVRRACVSRIFSTGDESSSRARRFPRRTIRREPYLLEGMLANLGAESAISHLA